ncbi:MAG: glycosyl transferase [Proteobacteria bacterium]|nr:glycosyl transferase [Pseudomonadota bacterium]
MASGGIPKIIHYCWFGDNPRSVTMERCIASWNRHCPGYELREWNETNSPVHLPYVRSALEHGRWANASNLVRLHAVHEHGGLYFDTDVEVVKSFDDLLTEQCFFGWQHNGHKEPVNNAVFGAVPRHPFIKELCDAVQARFDGTEQAYLSSPWILSELLKEKGLRPRLQKTLRSRFRKYGKAEINGVTLYPNEYFYPYAWYEELTADRITPNTHCIHYWAKSWG